jgi:hypothetical protein
MRHELIGGVLIALLLLLPGSVAAETIFWLDTPQDGATVFGLVEVAGYVLDDGEECGPLWTWHECEWGDALVSAVDLYVDDTFVASADLNQPRYDVLLAYPWYAGTAFERPGFSTSFNSATLTNGQHQLFLRITFSDSRVEDFGQRTVTVNNELNQAPFGELELPGPNQPMNGVYPLTGWALDDDAIATIEVLVDGLTVGSAVSGVHRPDIAHRFPTHPGAEFAGFVRMLNTTVFPNGVHSVAIRLTDTEGLSRIIGRRFVQTFNTTYNLPPFGGIDWPVPNHVMFAKGCADPGGFSTPPFEDPQVTELITGWALDVGSRTDLGGVGYLQLLIDGAIISDTLEGSDYWPWLQLDVNYYGHPRMDILRLFPDVPNAKDSGYAFRVDVSDLILRKGYSQGLHYLKVRAGDLENNVADIAQITVIFDCDDDPDRPAFGDIYAPEPMEIVAGVVEIAGWAVDQDDPEEVEVWLDGEFIDYVDEFGIESPEVEERFPWLPRFMTANQGFRYGMDTINLNITDGEHVLVLWARDFFGGRTIIGERRIVVDNGAY